MGTLYIGGSSSGGGTFSIQELTASSTVTTGTITGWDYMVLVDCSANNMIIALPSSAVASYKGHSVNIKRIDNSNNICKIIPSAATESIEGITNNSIYLYGKNDSVTITSLGSGDSKITADNRNSTGSSASCIKATTSTVMSNGSGFSTGTTITLDTVETQSGTNISLNTSTSIFIIAPNINVSMRGEIGAITSSSPNGLITARFSISTDNGVTWNYKGNVACEESPSGSSFHQSGGTMACFSMTTTTTTLVKFAIQVNNSNAINKIGLSGDGQYAYPWVEIEEVSRQATVINSVDCLNVSRISSDIIGVTTNSDLIFNNVVFGNIPFNITTGVATLTAGKTYELIGEPSFSSFSDISNGYLTYDWVDASTNVTLISNSQSTGTAVPLNRNANEFDNPIAHLIYTPSTNQTVKLRVNGGVGTATFRSSLGSKAIIRQIGSSATTGVDIGLLTGDIWQSYTPTLTCPGSTFHLVNTYVMKGLYRVVGKNMQLKFIYSHTNNTGYNEGSGSIPYQISIPNGYSIDTTKVNVPSLLTSITNNGAGIDSLPLGTSIFYNSSTPVVFTGKVVPLSTTTLGIHNICMNGTLTPFTLWGCGNSYYGGSNVELTFTAEIPIL